VLIFAPSFALIFALAPIWNRFAAAPRAGPVCGAQTRASSACWGPSSAIRSCLAGNLVAARLIALAAFGLIAGLRVAPWIVVLTAAALGAFLHA